MIFYCLESVTWGGILCFFSAKERFLSVLTWVFFQAAATEAANKTLSSKNKLTCFKTPLQLQSWGSTSLKNSTSFVLNELGGNHSGWQSSGGDGTRVCGAKGSEASQSSRVSEATAVTGRAQQPGICYAWLHGCCEDLINSWKEF